MRTALLTLAALAAILALPLGANGAGDRIIFVSDRDGNYDIYAMNPDGSGQVALTTNLYADSLPDVAGDGRIAFTSWRDGNSEIYVMGAYGGNNGDWPTSVMDDDQIENMNLPENFYLLQNYPNPFNARTTIRFVMTESQYINLVVYDLLGRKMETLLDGKLPSGTHSVIWDAENYSSSTYFYTIRSASSFETKKMILIK